MYKYSERPRIFSGNAPFGLGLTKEANAYLNILPRVLARVKSRLLHKLFLIHPAN